MGRSRPHLPDWGALAVSGSALTSFVDSQEHVAYQGTNQSIYQLVTHPGGWLNQQLPSGGLTALQGTKLTSAADLTHGDEYIFYCGQGQQGCIGDSLIYHGAAWNAYNLGLDTSPVLPFTSTWASQVGVLLFIAESEDDMVNFSVSSAGTVTWNNDFGAEPFGIVPGGSLLMFVDP